MKGLCLSLLVIIVFLRDVNNQLRNFSFAVMSEALVVVVVVLVMVVLVVVGQILLGSPILYEDGVYHFFTVPVVYGRYHRSLNA